MLRAVRMLVGLVFLAAAQPAAAQETGGCGKCQNDPAGTVHTFFGGSCTGGNYCYQCEVSEEPSEEGCESEETACHFDFEPDMCSECHESCEPTEELIDAVLAATQDPEAMKEVLSTGKNGLRFNADRGAVQVLCGTRVAMHVALPVAVAEALAKF